ncbi:MAG: sigma-70 family RNA polymerase sigma factor, partial [Flavobacteriales bacterium]|nr:sigma-70 family RNA polymerase sigma factor [Flavobacteriales bacterium]
MDEIKEMIEGCIRGEKRFQDILYRKYSSLLFGICLRYTKNRMEAQDVLQDVFVKVYRHIGSFTEGHSFEGWLRRIAVNTSITAYRKNQKQGYTEDLDEVVFHKDDPVEFNDLEFTQEELYECIQRLPAG